VKVVLIDYGAGNLHSVSKALTAAGLEPTVTSSPTVATTADALVLPGQGHFRQIMDSFNLSGFEPVVRNHLTTNKPFLGICVGLQILVESSEEAPGLPGLGLLKGTVRRFRGQQITVPQMGWNQVFKRGNPSLLENIPDGSYAYFANSYFVDFKDDSVPGATTSYGDSVFLSVLSDGNLHATQFHPEKSQDFGISVLKNFRNTIESYVNSRPF
jgi:glutamine amidotransferase